MTSIRQLRKLIVPSDRIAQRPVHPRHRAKLLVVPRNRGHFADRVVADLPQILQPGDVLVFNDTKVFPARLLATKDTGGKVELLLLRPLDDASWQVMVGGKVKPGLQLTVARGFMATVVVADAERTWTIRFNRCGRALEQAIDRYGHTPVPPYIKTESTLPQYQTTYAKHRGSAAAPTAGLHFSQSLLTQLKKRGVIFEYVTLHVGLGTFASIKTKSLRQHVMHQEWIHLSAETAARLNSHRKNGRRIIAVGTTATRVLQSCYKRKQYVPYQGFTSIFIYPPQTIPAIDGLITNFHVPDSTLILLVAAFAGTDQTLRAYQHALKHDYRFFSFGDAMVIL